MRVLVVGSGGREHALVWKLAQEAEVLCAPGNAGIRNSCECFDVPTSDHASLAELAQRLAVDLVVVGPEDPLIAGLADRLQESGVPVFGPSAAAAQLEGSKAFAKQLMLEAGVPNAESRTFQRFEQALEYTRSRFDAGRQVAIKASGAALGKGVTVCSTIEEADEALHTAMVERAFGEAGDTCLVEDRLFGREFSLLTLVSEGSFASLPVVQDYKRALDGDRGPNTGGMGTYSPVGWLDPDLVHQTEEQVVRPVVQAMADRGTPFRGVLFSGLMVQDGIPYCLEFNVRFGDPEMQTAVRRIGAGLAEALLATARSEPVTAPEVLDNAAVSVVMASGGYPGPYQKGVEVQIGPMPEGVVAFHAGTALRDGRLVTSGGRVLALSAAAPNLAAARALAYQGVQAVRFSGAHWRTDIAAP